VQHLVVANGWRGGQVARVGGSTEVEAVEVRERRPKPTPLRNVAKVTFGLHLFGTHLKVGRAMPDPIATAKANGQHFSDTTNYNEIVKTDDLDRVRKYHRDVPGDQSRQKLGRGRPLLNVP